MSHFTVELSNWKYCYTTDCHTKVLPHTFNYTVRPLLSGHPRDFEKWPLNRGWPVNKGTNKLDRKCSKHDFIAKCFKKWTHVKKKSKIHCNQNIKCISSPCIVLALTQSARSWNVKYFFGLIMYRKSTKHCGEVSQAFGINS